MHRATPYGSSLRTHTSGGARTIIDKVDDGPLMQTMNGNFMKGESRKDIEAPQNYGFTSVVADSKKGKDGQIDNSAEGFVSYENGHKSFPVCAVMDDRRHRLKNLAKDAAKGATAIYGQKEWGQQYLNTEKGQYITGNMKKLNRMQLVENKNGQKAQTQQQQQQGSQQRSQQRIIPAAQIAANALLALAVRNAEGKLVIPSKSGVEFEVEEFISDFIPVAGTRAADSGGGGGGGPQGAGDQQQPEGKSQDTGQKTLHKEDSTVWYEQNGTDTQSVHGEAYSTQKTGSDASTHWEKDKKKSTQCTEEHIHIRFKDHRIFNDKDGNWATSPIQIKLDKYCKEG